MAYEVGEASTDRGSLSLQASRQRQVFQHLETDALIPEQILLKRDCVFEGIEAKRCIWWGVDYGSDVL